MLINLSESNYSIKRNVRYFPWPRGATEKSLTCSGLRDPKIKHTHARALPASEHRQPTAMSADTSTDRAGLS